MERAEGPKSGRDALAKIELSNEIREAVDAMNRLRTYRMASQAAEVPKCHYIRSR